MTFRHDFGFVPSTEAEDGAPTDVLVLIDEPAFPGCLLKRRMIGIRFLVSRCEKEGWKSSPESGATESLTAIPR
jgi:inorganic pyrophosphatase